MAKNKEQNKPKEKFPVDYKAYYRYYDIFQLKQIKKYFNQVNKIIINKNLDDSPLKDYISIDNTLDKNDIYTEYNRYYNDFNYYCNKLIKGKGINSNDDYQDTIKCLINTICQLNQFINRYLILKSNKKFYNKKVEFLGKKCRLKNILLENENIMYKLNPDYIPSVISNFCVPTILFALFLGLTTVALITPGVFWKIASLVYNIWYLKILPQISYVEKINSIYHYNYNCIAHPLTPKIKFKDIATALSMIKDIIK